jgi:hypothetical protein
MYILKKMLLCLVMYVNRPFFNLYYDCSPESRKTTFPAGLAAGSCSELQPSAITIWLSSLLPKADEI